MGKAIIICITLFSAQLFCIVVYRLAPDLVVDVDLRVWFWGYFTLLFRDPGRYHATKSRRLLETDVTTNGRAGSTLNNTELRDWI